MRCRSGQHEWLEQVSAERCCSGKWHRATRWAEDLDDLDPDGRVVDELGFVHGWVRLPEEVMS